MDLERFFVRKRRDSNPQGCGAEETRSVFQRSTQGAKRRSGPRPPKRRTRNPSVPYQPWAPYHLETSARFRKESHYLQSAVRSRRAGVKFVASSARKEGHLMWPSSCAGLSEQQTKPNSQAQRPPLPKIFKKVVDARVTTRLIYPLRDGPVAQLVRASG